ncbi:hypothetical protein JL108_01525 [Aeromicrobium sp. YIM 150415]|uniref:hypothetical protein n=1 Tax=Aeromicrobium sp. YIM 150415 TaxID=2803912 RepID=UPI001964315A|nr:hypothetical protein [Aeromicrobium sp. YIM 150415]MBM9462107.1 hypothetical protein [Aeromicrobium sp. YIM 150415]
MPRTPLAASSSEWARQVPSDELHPALREAHAAHEIAAELKQRSGFFDRIVAGEAKTADVSLFSFVRFAWALSGAMGGSGLNCTVPIADMQVNWDSSRAPPSSIT